MPSDRVIRAFYSDGFAADIGEHVMPMKKFALVKERILERGLPARIVAPAAVTDEQLLRVHTAECVKAVASGEPRALAESQKFPWSPELAVSVRLTCGAAVDAARAALDDGVACAIASGYHHAHGDHGEGFCTFNGLVVDLDLHYGNGTASLLATRPELHNLSIYGSWYEANRASSDVTSKRAPDTDNCTSIVVPNGATGAEYLEIIGAAIGPAIARARPELIIYQAGADPYREDPYSPLDVGLEDLAERDARMFAIAHASGIPIAWVLAGGYTKDVTKVVEVHANTFAAAARVFADA